MDDFFHYCKINTPIHHHDPRFKLIEIVIWTVLVFVGSPVTMVACGIVIIFLHILAKSRLHRFRKSIRFWLIIAIATVVFEGMSGNGTILSIDGMISGAIRALKLLIVLLASQLLIFTTDISDIADALRSLIFFLPKKHAGILASAICLSISFIPRLIDEATRIRDAAMSRGLGNRKILFRYALTIALPLTEGIIRTSDVTSQALISRGFCANPTPARFQIRMSDWGILGICLLPGVVYMIVPQRLLFL